MIRKQRIGVNILKEQTFGITKRFNLIWYERVSNNSKTLKNILLILSQMMKIVLVIDRSC